MFRDGPDRGSRFRVRRWQSAGRHPNIGCLSDNLGPVSHDRSAICDRVGSRLVVRGLEFGGDTGSFCDPERVTRGLRHVRGGSIPAGHVFHPQRPGS